MRDIILERLSSIEKEREIEILYACESGSRAWGFPSPDSDYDVRFIYKKPLEWYLSLSQRKEDLDFKITDDLDINGWDIRKFLRLGRKSNATVFEWLQSPIIYSEKNNFRKKTWEQQKDFFVPKGMGHHYLGIAHNSLKTSMDGKEIKIKKYFYVLRPLLAAKWIAEKNEIPPMQFQKLLPIISKHKNIVGEIEKLMVQKENAKEAEIVKMNPILQSFIEQEYESIRSSIDNLESVFHESGKLDNYFRSIIQP